MTTNGFKRPAPVLPAMGLHSFNADSPPFAGLASSDQLEPGYFSLDGSPTSDPLPVSHPYDRPDTVDLPAKPASVPMPILQRGFPPNGMLSPGPAQSAHQRKPSTSEDEYLSSSRSRRLVSGYRFGNPPSPSGTRTSSPKRQPTPPARDGDSPPLTDPSPTLEGLTPRVETVTILQSIANMARSNAEGMRMRRNSLSRDRETGYDALNGLNDGEADLDENAPQAAFGTEAYLKGAEGEAGQYHFPRHRLRKTMKDESKIPLVMIACGSFSPPTYLHLRMFEMAKDEILETQTYEIMAGYYSPVSSYYKKAGLAPAIDRVRMCELGVEHTSTWLMVDPWEAGQSEYKRTAVVLEHFDEMLNQDGGGLMMSDGRKRKYKVMLLAGGDLIESFGEPGVWSEPDLHIILGRFGCLIVERAGSDVWAFLLSHDILYHHRRNVIVIKQLIYNDISSTKVRLFVRRGMSIKYLLPNSVIQYIYDHKLYRGPDSKTITK